MFEATYTYPGTGVACLRQSLENYDIDVIPGDRTAFFTFFAADIDSRRKLPWGASFLLQQGHTVIGIKGQGQDWYRGEALHSFMRSQEFRDYLAGFEKVVFYGGSKGGYGALAFSQLVEKPIVIAISPQSTLDRRLVPFETRFRVGQDQNWDGDFRDSVTSLKPDGNYSIIVDPFQRLDMKHIDRLKEVEGINLNVYKVPFAEHDVPGAMVKMKMLKDVVLACRDKTLTSETFARMTRARKSEVWYYIGAASDRRVPLAIRRKAIDVAAAIRPNDPTVRYAQATLMKVGGDYEDALNAFTQLLPDVSGKLLIRSNKAIADIQEAQRRLAEKP